MRGYVSEIFSSFQGEGLYAGRRHAFLRLGGCNLRCGYCDTPESLERTERCAIHGIDGSERSAANPMEVPEVASLLEPFLGAPGTHALAVTGGEPLVQWRFLAELLEQSRPPIPVLLETNGTYPERLEAVLPFVQIISMDVKLPSNSGEPPLWGEHAEFLRRSRGKTVYVKVPVDDSTADDEVRRAARLVAEAATATPFFLQPIVSAAGEMQVSASALQRFYESASRELADVRVLPQAHKTLGVR